MTEDNTIDALIPSPLNEPLSTESSPLVPSTVSDDGEAALWEELTRPWPSTFERSISLLASPLQRMEDIHRSTRSPKPGSSPMALVRRSDLDRGLHTPQAGHGLYDADGGFKHGVAKVHSLDYKKKADEILDSVSAEQHRKAMEAKAYRESILKKQKGKPKTKAKIPKGKAPVSKATFAQCTFNFVNILMGMGLLGLPFVFKSCGWLGGSLCLTLFAASSWRTAILIGRELNGDPRPVHLFDDSPFETSVPPGSSTSARMLPPITSFPDIARFAFGNVGSVVLACILYFELFSCVCVLLVAMGDHLHALFPTTSFNTFTIVVSIISLLPTVILRTPALLSYLSMIGTIATVILVMAVVMAGMVEGDITERVAEKKGLLNDGPYHTMWDTTGLALGIGIVSYCFSGHCIVPAIYTNMERPQDFEKMVSLTFVIVLTSSYAVAICGYNMFGSLVEDQVTLSLAENSHMEMAMKLLTWLMILTAFSKVTLTMFPLALGLEEIIAPFLTTEFMVALASASLKIVLTMLALLVSIYVPSFSFLVAMVGMLCTMIISIVFPAMAHLKLFGTRLNIVDKALDWSFILLGLTMTIVGTIATL